MSGARERSGIFKFLYIVLSIVTFPIFAIIYILKHPLWFLFFVLLALGVLVYFPMSDGVEISGVVDWYKKKYTDVRLEVVTKAVESGKASFVPKTIIEDVEKIKKNVEEEKEESLRVKGENYNDKIVRDDEFENVAVEIKKKKGFVRKEVINEIDENAKSLVEEAEKVGGLSAILKTATKKNDKDDEYVDQKLDDINSVLESLDAVNENLDEENIDEVNDILETENVDEEDATSIDDAKDENLVDTKEQQVNEDNKVILDEIQKVEDIYDDLKKTNEGLPDINNLVVDLPVVNDEDAKEEKSNSEDNFELELF